MSDKVGFVYLIKLSTGLYKLGRTKNLKKRHSQFRTIDPDASRRTYALVNNYRKCEKELIKRYRSKRAGAKEVFDLDLQDILEIESYLQRHKTTDRRFDNAY